jgi:hypothetical protein
MNFRRALAVGFVLIMGCTVVAVAATTPEFTLVNIAATSFPATVVGQSSTAQTIQITTTKALTIANIAIALSVNGHQEFSVGTVTGCTVNSITPANTTCSIPVTFSPTYSGLRIQTLTVTDSTGLVFSVGLYGYANGPQGVLSPGNVLTTSGASGGYYYSGDGGAAANARLSAPYNIVVDAMNNVYIADEVSGNVRVIYQAGAELACLIEVEEPTLFGLTIGVTSCAGATSAPVTGDIYTLGGDPTPYVTATSTHLKGSDDNRVATTITATTSTLNSPAGIAVDGYGNVVIGDYNAYKMRVIYAGGASMACLIEIENPTLFGLATGATSCTAATSSPTPGYIYTLLGGTGTSTPGATGDGGLANIATMTYAAATAISQSGDIFLVDDSTQAARTSRIRVIYNGGASAAALITAENPTVTAPVVGDVYKIAGGMFSSTGDGGLASSGGLLYARGLVLDSDGDLLFTDESTTSGSQTAKVRVVYGGGARMATLIGLENSGVTAKLGYMYTIGGSPTSGATGVGYSGDGGLATSALLTLPYSLTIDPAGDVYVSDYSNYALRKIDANDGKITTFAGLHTQGVTAGNALTTATLWNPYGMAWGAGGTLFFTDPGVYRIRSVSSTANPITFTVAAPVGNQSETEVLYESNTGTTAMTITAITPTINFAAVPSGSTVASDCTSTTVLQPGQTCAIGVAMVPTTGGTLTGTLTVYDNSLNLTGNSQSVTLTGTSAIQTSTFVITSNADADLGTNLTFTATVAIASGQNTAGAAALTGNVVFTAGTIALGSAAIDANGVATVSYSTLPAGTYSIKATFTPTATGYSGSSGTTPQVVVAPIFSVTTSTPGIAIVTGQSGTAIFSITTVGGYVGTVSASCAAPLPADITCSFSPKSITATADGVNTVTLTINTAATTAALSQKMGITFAIPFAAIALFLFPRRRRLASALLLVLLAVSAGTLAGCSNGTNSAARGTFNINAVFTDGITSVTVPVTVSVLGK